MTPFLEYLREVVKFRVNVVHFFHFFRQLVQLVNTLRNGEIFMMMSVRLHQTLVNSQNLSLLQKRRNRPSIPYQHLVSHILGLIIVWLVIF